MDVLEQLLPVVTEVVTEVAKHVHKKLQTNKEMQRLAKEVEESVATAVCDGKSPYEDEFRNASLQEVLAMLVDGVYYRDHSVSDFNLIVKPFIEGEYEVDERMAHFTSSLYWTRMESISEKEEEDAGIKHYIRHRHNPTKSAPSLVIAIRGTKLSMYQDLVDDIKIAMSTLHFSSRVKQGRDLIKKILEEYAKWQRGDNVDAGSESNHRELASRSLGAPSGHQNVGCDVCNMVPNLMDELCFLKHGSSKDYVMIDKPLGKSEPQRGRRPVYDDAESSESEREPPFSRSVGFSSPVQHPGVACDVCAMKPIIGTRYKSNKEVDYDLCQTCFLKHGRSIDYNKIETPVGKSQLQRGRGRRGGYDGAESSESERESPFSRSVGFSSPVQHPGVACDVCAMKPIIGTRYKSNKRFDYDLCQKCFQKNGVDTDYTKFDKPRGCQTRAPLQSQNLGYDDDNDSESNTDMKLARSRPALKLVHHPSVQCYICNTVPIVGIRYKSIRKPNYDLCQQCFNEKGVLKDYTKIEKPLTTMSSTSSTSSASSSSSATRDDIYITGHSLGAALALQIGKMLATEENQRYNVHCFNPPFMTIVQLMQQLPFISEAKDMLRNSPKLLINAASHMKSLAKVMMVMQMGKEDQLVEEVKHFMNLTDWVPVLYINSHDRICKRFRKYYKRKHRLSRGFEICSQALLSQLLGHRALFSYLVPSVDMRISKQMDDPHALKNWYRDPAIDKYLPYRLLPGFFVAGLPIHKIVENIVRLSNSSEESQVIIDEEFRIDESSDSDEEGEDL